MKYKDFLRKTKSGKMVYTFESLNDLAKITEEHKGVCNFANSRAEGTGPSREEFTGTKNLDEAINLLKFGWDKGVEDLSKKIDLATNSRTIKSEYNVVGGNCSVPRYLQGIPTNMILQKYVEKKDKVITICKNISYSSYITKNQILDESAKAIQVVQKLEAQGYKVNLYVIFAGNNHNDGNKEIIVKLKIKSSSERLNLKKMSFPLMHPSFLRRIVLKLIENDEYITPHRWSHNYGFPIVSNAAQDQVRETEEKLRKYVGEKDIIMPAMIGSLDTYVKSLNIK